MLRRDDIGSLEPGKRADLAVWRTDGLEFGGAEDLVANLVAQRPAPRRPAGRRRARTSCATARSCGATSRRSRASTANRREGYGRNDPLDPRARHRARPPGRGRAASSCTTPTGTLAGEGTTDDDGRIRELADTAPGTYRLVFHPPSPFFKRVELELELGEGHHHVPLLISSYACASYRGS